MQINKRFPSNLISSAKLNAALVPGLAAVGTKGPVAATVGLDKFAEAISVNLAAAPDNSSHARPSMLAHITSFAENVSAAIEAVSAANAVAQYSNLDAIVKQDFQEWQSMIAAVALKDIFSGTGLSLSVDTYPLSNADPIEKCTLMEMDKSTYQQAITARDPSGCPISGYLYYICQDGIPFALYHPEVGLTAMQQYPGSIFEGVLSWHTSGQENCHKAWAPLLEPGKPSPLDDVCLSRITWWANKNGMFAYAAFVKSFQKNPAFTVDPALTASDLIPNATNIDTVWPGAGTNFGSSVGFYQDANGVVQPLPLLFLDTLLLTYTGKTDQNKLIYNSPAGQKPVCFAGANPSLASFAPVPPFEQTVTDLFSFCPLQNLDFLPQVAGGNMIGTTVSMQILNPHGEALLIRKYYDSAHMLQGKIPYLMIWPYVPLPAGMNLWKEYYATWHDQSGAMIPVKNASGETIPMIGGISFNFKDQGTLSSVYRITAAKDSWPVCAGAAPFRYAIVENQDGNSLGVVFIPEYETYNPANPGAVIKVTSPVKLAVDFGTTSTVCALSTPVLNAGKVTPLPFMDYGRACTVEEPSAKAAVDVDHWLGNTEGGSTWQWDKKVFSVAQLFGQISGGFDPTILAAGNLKYWRDGRLFISSGRAMTNLANAAPGSSDPLKAQKIMVDMKFNENLNLDNTHAATVYLSGVYMYAVLYLLKNKIIPGAGPYLKVLASFPNDVTLNALKMNWSAAETLLGKVMDASLTSGISGLTNPGSHQFYNEATATAAYQRDPLNPLSTVPSLVSVDIGGGTTDISITSISHPNEVKELSVRYAGREIMVSTLIEYFRRFRSGAKISRTDLFSSLWEKKDPVLLNQFNVLCSAENQPNKEMFLNNLLQNSSLRMNIEMLLSDGMHMNPVAVSTDTNLLRQLITTKFIMLMRIVARSVRKNIDILLNKNGTLDLIGNKMEINLSISGASAQLMEYVFDMPIGQFAGFARNEVLISGADHCVELLETMFNNALSDIFADPAYTNGEENVTCRLKIFVDPNVKEKREVCYGMLEPTIDLFAGIAAAPAAAPATDPLALLKKPAVNAPKKGLADAARKAAVSSMHADLISWDYENFKKYLFGYDNGESSGLGLLNYTQYYEQTVFAGATKADRGLGADVNSISDLLNSGAPGKFFASGRMAVSNSRAQYMVEPAQADYKDLLANMYILEEILNCAMSELQSK